ncbi:MAG: hypothetical protein IJX12_03215 [Lachnospiraceae bacterium]|nr:hypothetical protein [Lachnospiraceae bacterium]
MSNPKMKKIISIIGTILLFVVGVIFYLNVSPEEEDGSEKDTQTGYENQDEYDYQDNLSDSSDEEYESDHSDDTSDEVDVDEEDSQSEESYDEVYETYEFRSQDLLDQHFVKHGNEFDYDTVEEYVEGANRVINDPESLFKIEEEDGDYIYYLESSNEFVVVSTDGYIRTYFKPSAGIDYFNRQ